MARRRREGDDPRESADGTAPADDSVPRADAGAAGPRPVWLIPIAVIVGYLALTGLDRTVFWDDESTMAIVARNFLRTGELTGWDGRNLLAYRDGTLLDERLHAINPPLEFWLAAASFRLFGATTWAGRLPFVVAGLLGLVAFALALRRDVGARSPAWVFAAIHLAGSVGFLLNIRQCRYYALALLFCGCVYGAYRECMRTRRPGWFVALAASAVLLFYSQYLIAIAFLLGLALQFVLFDRRVLGRTEFLKLGLAAAGFLALTAPHALAHRSWDRPDIAAEALPWLERKLTLVWWNLRDLNLVHFVPWALATAITVLAVRERQRAPVRLLLRWAVIAAGFTVFVALLSPQPVSRTSIADVRYLLPVLPFFAALAGWALAWVWQRSRFASVALLGLALGTNLFSLTPSDPGFRSLLPAYVREVHAPYPTGYGAAIQFLAQNAAPDELVVTEPDHAAYPLMFYLGDRVRFCCSLTPGSPVLARHGATLPRSLRFDETFPHWIVTFGRSDGIVRYFSRPTPEGRFQYELAAALDTYFGDTWRPELPWHSFEPVTRFDRGLDGVYVYRRSRARVPASERAR